MKKNGNSIKDYCKELLDTYPKYEKYLSLNNVISEYVLSIYYSDDISKEYDYKEKFTNEQSIMLSKEIINSISYKLSTIFDNYIENGSITFSKEKISHTSILNGKIKSIINQRNTICDSITLVHEFLHCIHLEKYNDISKEEYYFYTEIMGMIGDFYSIIYLFNNKKYIKEVQNYLIETINKLAICADEVLPFGLLLDVYIKNNDISKNLLVKYIEDNNISKDFINVLEHFNNEEYNYHDDTRYIFAFPLAFIISSNLFDDKLKSEYIGLFNQLPDISVDQLLNKLKIDLFFNDEDELSLVMKYIYTLFVDILSDKKVKKIGEI